MTEHIATCQVCGEPMPEGEQMFKFHGYSGPCPKPPLPKRDRLEEWIEKEFAGKGVAIRQEAASPIHGEPMMSMEAAKALVRRAVAELGKQ